MFELVTACRHLHRPSLQEMGDLVRPGGLLLYHTFVEGGCDHPSDPARLIKRGELAQSFSGFEVIRDDEDVIEDGRVMSFFMARKTIANATKADVKLK